jgi:RNA polymerase sigma-70 factor (ECF subfamily)
MKETHSGQQARPSFPSDPARLARFGRVMRAHLDLVLRRLRRLGVPAADLDDAAQDVFVVAARRIDDVMTDRERAFLLGTAARVASTRRRAARRRREDVTDLFDEHDPEHVRADAVSDRALLRPLLSSMLGELGEDTRAVFVLAEVEELPAPEIARELSIPLGTVGSRLRRARSDLKQAARRLSAREAFIWSAPRAPSQLQTA